MFNITRYVTQLPHRIIKHISLLSLRIDDSLSPNRLILLLSMVDGWCVGGWTLWVFWSDVGEISLSDVVINKWYSDDLHWISTITWQNNDAINYVDEFVNKRWLSCDCDECVFWKRINCKMMWAKRPLTPIRLLAPSSVSTLQHPTL